MLTLQNLNVLIIDDHEDCRMLLTFILEAEGARVTALSCASEALPALQQHHPNILISDIVMPSVDGFALIKQVRACEAVSVNSILAIALTAMVGAENYQQVIAAGFQRCLFKPLEPARLVATIVSLCESMNLVN